MATENKVVTNGHGPRAGLMEPLRLASLSTATYLSYWSLFFAVCRACSGRRTASNT